MYKELKDKTFMSCSKHYINRYDYTFKNNELYIYIIILIYILNET